MTFSMCDLLIKAQAAIIQYQLRCGFRFVITAFGWCFTSFTFADEMDYITIQLLILKSRIFSNDEKKSSTMLLVTLSSVFLLGEYASAFFKHWFLISSSSIFCLMLSYNTAFGCDWWVFLPATTMKYSWSSMIKKKAYHLDELLGNDKNSTYIFETLLRFDEDHFGISRIGYSFSLQQTKQLNYLLILLHDDTAFQHDSWSEKIWKQSHTWLGSGYHVF